MVTCEQLLGEVERALAGRYFTRRVTAEERIAYLALIRAIGAARPDPSPATATFSNTTGSNHPRSRFVTPAVDSASTTEHPGSRGASGHARSPCRSSLNEPAIGLGTLNRRWLGVR
jgi:hypothetical protein